MFKVVKGFKKEDLSYLAIELGETVAPNSTISVLKDLILNSEEYKRDPEFVQEILVTAITDRKVREEEEKEMKLKEKEMELKRVEKEKEMEWKRVEKEKEMKLKEKEMELKRVEREKENERDLERERMRLNQELELARIQAQSRMPSESILTVNDSGSSKRKFELPKLQFRQFEGDLKEWLPFWSQFEQIDKDNDIPPENKFQYLIQATVVGSRAREVVESFPPTSANYVKVIESLKSRFGKEDMLVEVYVRELLKLIISVQSKEKFSLTSLYDKLECYLRALETLGVTTEKCASILYPMVESCFTADFLKAWNRSNSTTSTVDAKERLNNLMQFLKTEVEGEERISLAVEGFGLTKKEGSKIIGRRNNFKESGKHLATAATLYNSSKQDSRKVCIFCNGNTHFSTECFIARKMSSKEKQNILKDKKCCFACFSTQHIYKQCKANIKCFVCSKRHHTVVCPMLDKQSKLSEKKEEVRTSGKDVNLANLHENPKVFLQTLKATIVSGEKEKCVRVLLDSGSQRSYILKDLAREMSYETLRQEKVMHTLFGGVTINECKHNYYKISLRDLKGNYRCNFDALDQNKICENISPISEGAWLKELKAKNIVLSDVGEIAEPIQVLIGADIMGRLLTGRRIELSSGLVAIETHLGWTLMGKFMQQSSENENLALSTISLFVKEADISNLWRLDLIGITDPIEKKSKEEIDRQTKQHFLETIKFNSEQRYEICLPWAEDTVTLPNNFNLAMKRLQSTTAKLVAKNLYTQYENVFLEWLNEGIIEEVPIEELKTYGNYLPHHPVIKENSSTTPIRPVFDASAKLANHPSLNQVLQSGPIMLELIPDVLLRFRERRIGVIADIRKAFLQISIYEADRNFLRFLWWKQDCKEKKLRLFRHARVVFGVKCSPFLLASVIEYHIKNTKEYEKEFKEKLLHSFYVDNVVTSVNNQKELEKFMFDSRNLMEKGGFDLRQWEYTCDENDESTIHETNVLGLLWNKTSDTLQVNLKWLEDFDTEIITKRNMLSIVHKVFDPFGILAPVVICPKILLQKAWRTGIKWDEEITGELRKDFHEWFQELKFLRDIKIPRYMKLTPENLEKGTLHTFVDGSKDAYAAVIFLRIEIKNKVELVFITAKSRVAPLKNVTIPRMELLAATMGTRLAKSVIEALRWEKIETYYWSDSTTVLAWITRDENWSVFVRNRVREIRKLSNPSTWRHVLGDKNPADLPSRGCKAKHLTATRWWEGPCWLRDPKEFRKYMIYSSQNYDEEQILNEKLKTISMITRAAITEENQWYYKYFSNYDRIVRLISWIFRFAHNCRNSGRKQSGELTAVEYRTAEIKTLRMVQKETFSSDNDDRLKTLKTWKDEHDIIRLSTKLTYRKDSEDFINPIVLPGKHEVVRRLILTTHLKNCHAGLQILLNILREKYWILNGRKTVKQVLNQCSICKRFSSKNLWRDSAPLPENRTKDADVFQITGVDMAGPLYLKNDKKSWILIFTCAIYRAVHLELVTAASTEAFILGLRRFIARRGRCGIIYCDNGTNFVGTANLLKNLDWTRIQKHASVNAIVWKFNPPTAAWWGGFWERLIRVMKDLLKRVLGRASLTFEEMITVLADVESIINSRPLTYLSEDATVKPISPAMFLQNIQQCEIPDIDAIEEKSLSKRLKYRQVLLKELKKRFRSEYLGALIQHTSKTQQERDIAVGDIVLIGSDNKKRMDWPLGRVTEVIPGRDHKIRLVKVQTSQHEILRPIQRIYPLEISSFKEHLNTQKILNMKKTLKESDDVNVTTDDSNIKSNSTN